MGKSFFTGTDNELYLGSDVFSTLISAAPTTYGLVAGDATAYAALNAAYAAAYVAANAPETRTKVTITNKDDAAVSLRAMASLLAKKIDGTATVTNGMKEAIGLSVRKTPAPFGPPGQCSDFKSKLLSDGSIESTFKANNPTGMSGVTYQIWRRIGSEGEFNYLVASGEKKFVDATIPAGTQQVQYQVRGIRPTAAGAWAQFNVNFGMTTGGMTMASVVETKVSPKLAA